MCGGSAGYVWWRRRIFGDGGARYVVEELKLRVALQLWLWAWQKDIVSLSHSVIFWDQKPTHYVSIWARKLTHYVSFWALKILK